MLYNQEIIGFFLCWLAASALVLGGVKVVKVVKVVVKGKETKTVRRMKADSQMPWLEQRLK